jgi:molecular chaperone HtpG
VVNTAHPLVKKVLEEKTQSLGAELEVMQQEIKGLKAEEESLEKEKKGKKEEEIPSEEKEKLEEVRKRLSDLEEKKRNQLKDFGKQNKLAKQLVDLALLANGLLKGADLDRFVKRSVELIK